MSGIDRESFNRLTEEVNEHAKKIEEIDDRLISIQQSTRTLIRFLQPLHEKARKKWRWYYEWHTRPNANKINWTILVVFVISAVSGVLGFTYLALARPAQNSSDTIIANVDSAQKTALKTASEVIATTGTTGETAINTTLSSLNGSNLTNLSKSQVGLSNVEDTALSTWSGSANITNLGTINTGAWNGTAIAWSKTDKTNSSLSDLTVRSASDLTSGTLDSSRLSIGVTLQGNNFNGANQLVQLDSSGFLPSMNGSALTNLSKNQVGLSNVDDIAISSWIGSNNITTLGIIGKGTWEGDVIGNDKISSVLTGKTYNGLALNSGAAGFSIAGGIESKILTVGNNASIEGINTGDQDLSGLVLKTTTINGQVLSSNVVFNTGDINDSLNKRYVSDANLTTIGNTSGINTGDQTLFGLGGAPLSRTINGYSLNDDVTITKDNVGLSNVENTALSTWSGSANITNLGTINTGAWNGTAISWDKTDKTNSSLADLTVRSASDLTSGTLDNSRLSTNVTVQGNTTTGTGNIVKDTSPTLTTPTLGMASATTINKLTITAPTNSATLTIADGKTLTVNNSIILAAAADSKILNIGSNNLSFSTVGDTSLNLPTAGTLMVNPMTNLGDIIYNGAGSIPTRLGSGTINQVLHGGTTPSYSAVVEADMNLSDNTTNDVSIAKHGFVPKATNNTTQYLRGDGTWASPSLSTVWSALTNPSGNLSLNMGANSTAFSWLSGNSFSFSTVGNLTIGAHIKSTQSLVPIISMPINCGPTNPSASIAANSTDSAGSFTITAGTGTPRNTCDTTITFRTIYDAAPKSIILSPGNTSTATLRNIYVSASSATSFTVKLDNTPAGGQINTWYYWVIE